MLKGLLCLLFPDLPLVSFKKCLSYIYFVFVLIAQNTKMKGWTVLAKFCLPPEGLVAGGALSSHSPKIDAVHLWLAVFSFAFTRTLTIPCV